MCNCCGVQEEEEEAEKVGLGSGQRGEFLQEVWHLARGKTWDWWCWAGSLLTLIKSCKPVGTVTAFLIEESKITSVSSEVLLLSGTLFIHDIVSLDLLKSVCQINLKVSQLACILSKSLSSGKKVCPALPPRLSWVIWWMGCFLCLF